MTCTGFVTCLCLRNSGGDYFCTIFQWHESAHLLSRSRLPLTSSRPEESGGHATSCDKALTRFQRRVSASQTRTYGFGGKREALASLRFSGFEVTDSANLRIVERIAVVEGCP